MSANDTATNSSQGFDGEDPNGKNAITWDDATWILTSAFIIFTMQSGFGMLESGVVNNKNTVNIMVKNVVDVVFGGMTYWMFGYALSFGEGPYSNPFCGIGDFFVDTSGEDMGIVFSTFVFQLSFATTATTIVSGAMAERTNLTAYIVFSFFNTVVFCMPAHWIWSKNGFLSEMGAIDFAGSGVVHLVGACSGLVAAIMLKPRTGRYDSGVEWPALVNPVNAIIGTFMLWWGWLAFNCGSTFGISGGKWMLASKCAFTTLISSMSGGIAGIFASAVEYHDLIGQFKRKVGLAPRNPPPRLKTIGKYDVGHLINSILGALVSITASCPLVRSYEAVVIGVVGALCTLYVTDLMNRLKIDDPVSAIAVHGASGLWGLLAVALFAEDDQLLGLTKNRKGLLKGGGFYLLGIQTLSIVCEVAWAMFASFVLLFIIDKTLGLRVSLEEELLGADYCEHNIKTSFLVSNHGFPYKDTARRSSKKTMSQGGSPETCEDKTSGRERPESGAGEGEEATAPAAGEPGHVFPQDRMLWLEANSLSSFSSEVSEHRLRDRNAGKGKRRSKKLKLGSRNKSASNSTANLMEEDTTFAELRAFHTTAQVPNGGKPGAKEPGIILPSPVLPV